MADTVLTLVRHGETSANLEGVWHGSTDTALTDRGHAQAARVARFLGDHQSDAVAVYSSPLQRAQHTAARIAGTLSLEPVLDPDLTEYDLGDWEGKTYKELFETHRLWEHMKTDPDFAPHGGESPRRVAERYTEALHRIAARHRGARVIVVGHGGAFSMALAALVDGDYTRWRRAMHNCAFSELCFGVEVSLVSFDRKEHLEGL